jgi:glycerophosphoryl diester phosphodiesterase
MRDAMRHGMRAIALVLALPPATTCARHRVATSALEIAAHRGARGQRPENTLSAFEAALRTRADVIELDLHLSADDRVVVWHDGWVAPEKCDVPAWTAERPPALIREMTTAQLAALRCARNPEPWALPDQTAPAGEAFYIPTLDEVLERLAPLDVRLRLDIKRHPFQPDLIRDGFRGRAPGILERKTVAAIRKHELVDRVIVQSFEARSLAAMQSLEPRLRLAALTEDLIPNFERFAAAGIGTWSPEMHDAIPSAVRDAHRAGLRVVPWTVNDPRDIERLLRRGVDGVITDHPGRARAVVDRLAVEATQRW